MKQISIGLTVAAITGMAHMHMACAETVDAPPVGTSAGISCTGTGAGEFTWKIVKNDGQNYRTESSSGNYSEGPIWGCAINFRTEFSAAGGGKILNTLETEDLKSAGELEVGKTVVGYVQSTNTQNRTNQQRYDVIIKEKAERETPFGKVEAYLVVSRYGNAFWNATLTNWYAPSLKSLISSDFESNQGDKSSCRLMTKPQ